MGDKYQVSADFVNFLLQKKRASNSWRGAQEVAAQNGQLLEQDWGKISHHLSPSKLFSSQFCLHLIFLPFLLLLDHDRGIPVAVALVMKLTDL